MKRLVLGCGVLAVNTCILAQEIKSQSFTHQDWEIYCSNTGTCRAAGYQNEEGRENPASLLLTRHAGAKQAVVAEFALASYAEQSIPANQLKNIRLYINDKDLGAVSIEGTEVPLMGKLSPVQVNALLQQAKQKTKIVFKNNTLQWKISDAGMTAVLLKMDDIQRRLGTVGALIQKGQADESRVLPAQPKIVIKPIKTANKPYLTLQSGHKQYPAIYASLMAAQPTPKEDGFCEGFYDSSGDGKKSQSIQIYKLGHKKVLAMMPCWRGAYNQGYGAWVLDESLTGKASFVTEAASGFEAGVIDSAQKGRGIGDCWAVAQWIWDGQRFIQSKDMWTGMCKGLAAGGVWELDRIESVIK